MAHKEKQSVSKGITQKQMFYQEQKKIADINNTFMELVKNGLTKQELARNIERRPALWDRFSGFLQTLPSEDIETEYCAACNSEWAKGLATHDGDCPCCGKTSGYFSRVLDVQVSH
jgi:hypothetical protein